MMDRQYINDRHVVARYLADQLSDSEREEFEAFCAQNPDLFREIEATARFKAGLAKLAESGDLEAALAKPPGLGAFALRHAASLAAVGIGVVALVGAVYALRVPAMGASVAEVSGRFRSELPVAANFEIMRMRDSVDVDQRLSLPATPAALRFRVLPDIEGKPAYRATLSQETTSGTRLVASADGLKPDEMHFVSFYLNSVKLVPGTYFLKVVPDETAQQDSEPSFRIEIDSTR